MGFDTGTVWYHATIYDFSEFVPSQWRGASYFAPTADAAERGMSAGGSEHPALGGPTTDAPATGKRIIPVYVAGKIWGRDPLPADWLPETLTYGEFRDITDGRDHITLSGMTAGQNRWLNFARVVAAREYYTEAVPETEYERYRDDENALPMRLAKPPVAEPFGYEGIEGGEEPNAFAPSGSLGGASKRAMLKRLGYVGWIVNDEGGKSIAIADPTKVRAITARFDPHNAGSNNIMA